MHCHVPRHHSAVVHKVTLDVLPATQTETVPVDAVYVHVDHDTRLPGHLAVWYLTENPHRVEEREFTTCPTGSPIPGPADYLGSVRDGTEVWHVLVLGRLP